MRLTTDEQQTDVLMTVSRLGLKTDSLCVRDDLSLRRPFCTHKCREEVSRSVARASQPHTAARLLRPEADATVPAVSRTVVREVQMKRTAPYRLAMLAHLATL